MVANRSGLGVGLVLALPLRRLVTAHEAVHALPCGLDFAIAARELTESRAVIPPLIGRHPFGLGNFKSQLGRHLRLCRTGTREGQGESEQRGSERNDLRHEATIAQRRETRVHEKADRE